MKKCAKSIFLGFVIFIGIISPLLLSGCKDDVDSAGAHTLLPGDEDVRVCSDTLIGMVSRSDSLQDFLITQTPDSFLLGEVNTKVWATIKADLMTQFACPTGYKFPADVSDQLKTEIDSIALVMTCRSWFADGNSPLRLSVYELDKSTFIYDHVYSCHEDLSAYWSGDRVATNVVQKDQIVVAAQPSDSVYSSVDSKYYPYVRFMMNERFIKKMNTLKSFPSQEEFNQFFKGLYITSTWGASTALYVDNITMIVYYHYYFEDQPGSGTYKKMTDIKYLYANNEVRQINRFSFPNKNEVIREMEMMSDTINYVISPGYVYTVLELPMTAYVDTILGHLTNEQGKTLQPYVNKAVMRVEVLNAQSKTTTSERWASPAQEMLLIRADSLQTFFARHRLPSAEYCLLSSIGSTVKDDNSTSYHYDFDVSTMLYNEVHNRMNGVEPQNIQMVMIPVSVSYTTSSSATVVSEVKIDQTITFTEIRSAQIKTDPLDIEVVFSGFTINTIH